MGAKRRFDSQEVVGEPQAGANPDLQTELHVYAARASQLHARLLVTLDKLDTLRAKHDEEMAAEKRIGDVLTRRLARFQRYIKESRSEWDDAREALSIVIEKVELANDYSLWPHSHMCMTSPLEPLPNPKVGPPGRRPQGDSTQLYAKAVIASLREELEQERSAHAHTRAQAEADILALTARLARREAELEEHNIHGAESRAISRLAGGESQGSAEEKCHTQRGPERPPIARPAFSREETIQILEVTALRNRELEVEVRHLRQSCDQARSSSPSEPRREQMAEAGGQIDESRVSDPHKREDPSTVDVTASAPIPNRTRVRSAPPDLHSQHTGPLVPIYDFVQGQIAPRFRGSSAGSDTLVSRGTAIHQLQLLVDIFASQLDRFSAERSALKAALAAKEQSSDIRTHNEGTDSLGGEDECHRLRETVHSLTHSFKELRASSKAREAQLQGELDMMRLEVARMASRESTTALLDPEATARVDAPPKAASPWSVPGTQSPQKLSNVLDEGETECSMELATPLQPTILSVRDDISDLGGAPSQPPDPSLASLPPAPDIPAAPLVDHAPVIEQPSPRVLLPSIFLSSPVRDPPLWWPHPRSPQGISDIAHPDMDAPRRMELIERDLLFARQELSAKNEELEELRGIVDQLRELVYAGESDGEQGPEEVQEALS